MFRISGEHLSQVASLPVSLHLSSSVDIQILVDERDNISVPTASRRLGPLRRVFRRIRPIQRNLLSLPCFGELTSCRSIPVQIERSCPIRSLMSPSHSSSGRRRRQRRFAWGSAARNRKKARPLYAPAGRCSPGFAWSSVFNVNSADSPLISLR